MYRMMQSDLNNGRFCGNLKMPQAVTERNRRHDLIFAEDSTAKISAVFAEGENHEDALPERGSV